MAPKMQDIGAYGTPTTNGESGVAGCESWQAGRATIDSGVEGHGLPGAGDIFCCRARIAIGRFGYGEIFSDEDGG